MNGSSLKHNSAKEYVKPVVHVFNKWKMIYQHQIQSHTELIQSKQSHIDLFQSKNNENDLFFNVSCKCYCFSAPSSWYEWYRIVKTLWGSLRIQRSIKILWMWLLRRICLIHIEAHDWGVSRSTQCVRVWEWARPAALRRRSAAIMRHIIIQVSLTHTSTGTTNCHYSECAACELRGARSMRVSRYVCVCLHGVPMRLSVVLLTQRCLYTDTQSSDIFISVFDFDVFF